MMLDGPVLPADSAGERCAWVGMDPLMIDYHDREWGVPTHDDRRLFEHLVLGGAQAGLSWATILRRREGYRELFAGFDPDAVAAFGPDDFERLMASPQIIRNRQKIASAITNARAILAVIDEHGSLDRYLWSFVGGQSKQSALQSLAEIPAQTDESRAMSVELRKRGFSFVGPTICYAVMQAVGMVNDHLVTCFRYAEVRDPSEA